jgi:hypothetical protein
MMIDLARSYHAGFSLAGGSGISARLSLIYFRYTVAHVRYTYTVVLRESTNLEVMARSGSECDS